MEEQTQNINSDIALACIEEKFFQREIIIEEHSIVRILSGEMRVVQADRSYTFVAGDTLLFPRNQLATVIKYPKDGLPYKSVLMYLRIDRVQHYYAKNPFPPVAVQEHKIIPFKKHLLLDSFFASLMPYFEMDSLLPENIVSLKIEEAISVLRAINPATDAVLTSFSEPGKINLADFMEKNYMFNLTIDRFGYLTGRSLTTFKKDFKKIFNTTPQRWLTMKRLDLAHYQIAKKKRKPTEVYFEVGFENLSHFSYAFKKQFGYPPTEIPA